MTFWQNIYYKVFKSGSKIYLLIGINVIVFLLINVLALLGRLFFSSDFISVYTDDYLALPAYLPKLLVRFWTPLTYMFMHAGIMHILFNMLWLYWMGQIFEDFLGNKRILGVYLLGGLFGAIFFVASFNIFPLFTKSGLNYTGAVVGASAGVMAVIAAAATIVPNYIIRLFGILSVKLKWLVLFYIALDVLAVTGPNAGGQIAHLGGALFGFLYVKQLQNGNDIVAFISNMFKRQPSKLKVVSTNRDKTTTGIPRQDEVDLILDKISKVGYDNLSKQEKETLFRASKNEEK